MASKRTEQRLNFDDFEEIEALARAYPGPPLEFEDMALEAFPEAARAWRVARWFTAASKALMNPDLPEHERQRLGLAVESVAGRTAETPDDKRRRIINIVKRAAGIKPLPDGPDDEPELTPEEMQLTPQQRMASFGLFFFKKSNPVDGRLIDEKALLDAVHVWSEEPGFTSDKRAKGGGKYKLIARAIRKTSFKCEGATDDDGGDQARLVELARDPRPR